MRETDVAARMGGEEFVALLPGVDLEEVRAFAERIRRALGSIEEAGSRRPRSAPASAQPRWRVR